MKKHFLVTGVLFCACTFLRAQQPPCLPNGVLTNPASPVNPQHPGYANFFDWTDGWYDYYLNGNRGLKVNPYYSGVSGVIDLYGDNDFKPEDGWELVYMDLGVDSDGSPLSGRSGHIWFVLYNRYRSFMRLFVAIANPISLHSMLEIELSFEPGGYYSALFSSLDKVQKPLRYFDNSTIASGVKEYYNGSSRLSGWFYADFPVSYDPCTCKKSIANPSRNSEIHIEFKTQTTYTALIGLNGTSTGTVTIVGPVNYDLDGGYGITTKKTNNHAIKAGIKAYKGYSAFQRDAWASANGKPDEQKIKDGIDHFHKVFKVGLMFVPFASKTLGLFDFLISGGKKDNSGPQETIFPPFALPLEQQFSGILTTEHNYMMRNRYTPGSNFTLTLPQPPADREISYPVYNEILGAYTLLDKPKIKCYYGPAAFYQGFETTPFIGTPFYTLRPHILRRYHGRKAFKIDKGSIHLAVNPASGLDLVEAYVQLIVIDSKRGKSFPNGSRGTLINDSTWVSDIIPISCADNHMAVFDEYWNKVYRKKAKEPFLASVPIPGIDILPVDIDVNLSTVLVLENSQGDRFLHKATWETDYEIELFWGSPSDQFDQTMQVNDIDYTGTGQTYSWFDQPEFAGLDTGFLHTPASEHFQNETVDDDVRVQEWLTMKNSTVQGAHVTAGQHIEVLPDSDIDPDSELSIYTPGIDCDPTFDLAPASVINSVCNSSEYQSSKDPSKRQVLLVDDNEPHSLPLFLYPNPASNLIHVAVQDQDPQATEVAFALLDVTGRQVLSQTRQSSNANRSGYHTLTLPELSSGVYMLYVTAGKKTAVEKVIIQ